MGKSMLTTQRPDHVQQSIGSEIV